MYLEKINIYLIFQLFWKNFYEIMEFLNEDLRLKLIQLTWRNPAFMAIAIALIWLIPQLLIRKIMSEQYEKNKLDKQKQKIKKLYP